MTRPSSGEVSIRRVPTAGLSSADRVALRALFDACWPDGDFSAEDEAHAMGGMHWIAEAGGRMIGHASVVPRVLEAAGIPLAGGYVEAVATHPGWRRRGIASRLMEAANAHLREAYELGALSTDVPGLYTGVGWERWHGPTFVRTPRGLERTEDEDEGILVLRTPRTPPLAGTEPLACEWRTGDCW